MKIRNYQYDVDDYGDMTIFVQNENLEDDNFYPVATISDCKNMSDNECEKLCEEILEDSGFVLM